MDSRRAIKCNWTDNRNVISIALAGLVCGVQLYECGQNESITDHSDTWQASTEKQETSRIPKYLRGFQLIGPAGFEPTTSTTPR
jgi:hypothetical protein